MSDINQTIQDQIDLFNANTAHASMSLVQLGTFLAGQLKPITDADARTVTTDVLVMDVPGRIEAVWATAGNVTGIMLIGPEGATLRTLTCTVAYDVNGIATITFFATDAVTAAKITYSEAPYPSTADGRTVGLGNILALVPT